MDFDWSQDDHERKKSILAIFGSDALRELENLERVDTEDVRRIIRRFLKDLAAADYLRIGVGPSGRAETLNLLAAQEELARMSRSLFLSVEVTGRLFGGLLTGFLSGPLVSEIVRSTREGDIIGAVAITEPAQSDEGVPMARLSRFGSDHLSISGKKDFVTNGPIADWIGVILDEQKGKSVCLVRPDQKGVVIGPRLMTLGYNGLAVSSLELNDVQVSPETVFGPFDGSAVIEFLRQTEDMTLSMASVGLMQAAIAKAKDYAQSHRRDGKPIFAHQEIRFKLAEMLTLYQSAQLLVFRAGWMISSGQSEGRTLVRCAKVFAAEASEKVATLAMQILCGQGYVRGNLIERAYRDAKYAAIAGTTSERARMEIAEDVLVRYG